MNKFFLLAKISIFSLIFFSLTSFDWVDDINKKVTTALTSEEGGIPAHDISSISETIISSRAKSLDLSASKMPFQRLDEKQTGEEIFQPALKGDGKNIANPSETVKVSLSLNKKDCRGGNALVTLDGKEHVMRIAAAQLFGDPDDTSFEYIYLLSGLDNTVAYLAIISNVYEIDNKEVRGFEGTLLYPGQEKWNNWNAVYKVDFGYKFAVVPEYQVQINASKDKVSELRSSLNELKKIKRQIVSFTAKAEKKVGTPDGDDAKRSAGELEKALIGHLQVAEKNLLNFYGRYNQVLEEYKGFAHSNQYTWLSPEIQKNEYSIEKGLGQINRHMKTIHNGIVALMTDAIEVEKARKDSMERFGALQNE